jgi:hypothetical protein
VSHFFTLVIIPKGKADVESEVHRLLAPFDENGNGDETHWDWFQVGGRWTGTLDGYDPEADPKNSETCWLCNGTGKRADTVAEVNPDQMKACNGCNGCNGTGTSKKWPTDWKRHDGDIVPVAKLARPVTPHAIVTPDGEWLEQGAMGWFGSVSDAKSEDAWKECVLATLKKHSDGIAVVVDCHV